jgi:hypothetical protein
MALTNDNHLKVFSPLNEPSGVPYWENYGELGNFPSGIPFRWHVHITNGGVLVEEAQSLRPRS